MIVERLTLKVKPQHLPFQIKESGSGVDLTGATISAQITIGEVTRDFNVGNGGIVVTDAANGKWNLVITNDDVAAFARRIGTWLMKIVWGNGDEWPLIDNHEAQL